jgi:hypothetical protein
VDLCLGGSGGALGAGAAWLLLRLIGLIAQAVFFGRL